uniref:RxLR effector candidate protein n=1 Tax=Peronospora matthiolae TaxID=2874970 RepID=A0AAV1URL4_9STRA
MRMHYLRLALLAALYMTRSAAVSQEQDEPTERRLLRTEGQDATDADNEKDQQGEVGGGTAEDRGLLQRLTAGLEHELGTMLGKQSLIEDAAAKKAAEARRQARKKAAPKIKKLHRELVKNVRLPAPASLNKEKGVVQTHPDTADLIEANLKVYYDELVARHPGIHDAYLQNVLAEARKVMKADATSYKDSGDFYGVMSVKDVRWLAAHNELDLNRLLEAGVPAESFAKVLGLKFEDIKTLGIHRKSPNLDRLNPLTRIFLKYEWMKIEKDFYTSKMKKALVPTAKVHPVSDLDPALASALQPDRFTF